MNSHVIEIRFVEYVSLLKESFNRIKPLAIRINESNARIAESWRKKHEVTAFFQKLFSLDFWFFDHIASSLNVLKDVAERKEVIENTELFIRTLDSQSQLDPNKKVLISIEDYATLCERIYYDDLKPYQLTE